MKSPQAFIEGQYVRVFGIIKSLQGQKNVQAFKIVPVRDLNEIAHHILDCMNTSIYYYAKANGEVPPGADISKVSAHGGYGGAKQTMHGGDSGYGGGLSGFSLNVREAN